MTRLLQPWEKEMADCVDSKTLRAICGDHRNSAPPQRPATVSIGSQVHKGAKGWVEPRPMAAPRGNWLTEDEIKERERLRQKIRELDQASIAEQKQNDPPA